jgi:hypothetical protein
LLAHQVEDTGRWSSFRERTAIAHGSGDTEAWKIPRQPGVCSGEAA